ncbi:MAG: hypothetical protein IJX75_01795 [Clostridia bacterium]|nr:hypothetical protein [Clostridia bacterium]
MRKTPIHYEKDFEKDWDEEKKAGWERLKMRLNITEEPTPPPIPQKKNFFSSPARLVTVCASVALLIGIGIGVGIGFSNPPTPQVQSSSSAEIPPDENRYCTQSEYTIEETGITLKEYSLQNDGKILYFDWYENLDGIDKSIYFLNESQEIIAFKEELLHSDTGYSVILSVTDNHTQLEDFNGYTTTCTEQTNISNISIQYRHNKTIGYAMWEFDGYKYYMEVQNIMSQNELFALVEELLRE